MKRADPVGMQAGRAVNGANQSGVGWKHKVYHELVDYWMNVVYLTLFFGVFMWYRRFILAEYEIAYLHYGIAVIQALVLAKVIMIGDIVRLGRGLEDKPLIFPTLYKAAVFSVFVGLFKILEHTIRGLLHRERLAGGMHDILSKGRNELLAYALIIFFTFIPFFAFKELGRVLGKGSIRHLFFRRRAATETGKSHDAPSTMVRGRASG